MSVGQSHCEEMSFPNTRTINEMMGMDIGIL